MIGSGPAAVDITFPEIHGGPQPGDSFHLTFEIRLDGSHPYSWACLPTLGPFVDWDLANSVALRIAWTSRGGIKREMYIRRIRVLQYQTGQEKSAKGELSGYLIGRAIRRFLLRQPVTAGSNHMQPQDYDLGLAMVRVLDIDFFNMQINIGPPLQVGSPPPSSARKSYAVLKEEMEGLGLTNIGKSWTDLVRENSEIIRQGRDEKWNGCDGCLIRFILKAAGKGCARKDSNFMGKKAASCGDCSLRGLPCSWTKMPVPVTTMKKWSAADKYEPPNATINKWAAAFLRQSATRNDLYVSRHAGTEVKDGLNENTPEETEIVEDEDALEKVFEVAYEDKPE